VTFEPYYVVGSPDYEAIAANGFTEYVDIGLDAGVSQGWARGPSIATARQASAEGLWQPEYHARTHHFSSVAWVRRLRAGEPLARDMFQRRMYVCEEVARRTYENLAPGPEPLSWLRTGAAYLARAFGRAPQAIRNREQDETAVVAAGFRVRVNVRDVDGQNATGRRSPVGDLFYLGSCADFEPFLYWDREDVVARCLERVQAQWRAGRPAFVSTHRRNYVSLLDDAARSLDLLDQLLGRIQQEHAAATFLTSGEVRQLWETGGSVRQYGPSPPTGTLAALAPPKPEEMPAVVRNWTEDGQRPLLLPLPAGHQVRSLSTLPLAWGAGRIEVSDDGRHLLAFPGDYLVTLAPAHS
jgi:hypothetical protein